LYVAADGEGVTRDPAAARQPLEIARYADPRPLYDANEEWNRLCGPRGGLILPEGLTLADLTPPKS
jgi:hypothetical protein